MCSNPASISILLGFFSTVLLLDQLDQGVWMEVIGDDRRWGVQISGIFHSHRIHHEPMISALQDHFWNPDILLVAIPELIVDTDGSNSDYVLFSWVRRHCHSVLLCGLIHENGPGGTRTPDFLLKRQTLYQLSYWP